MCTACRIFGYCKQIELFYALTVNVSCLMEVTNWYWPFYLCERIMCLKSHVFWIPVVIWQCICFLSVSTSQLVESSKGSTQNLPKYQTRWSRSLKRYYALCFFKGALYFFKGAHWHRFQTDIVQWLVFFVPSLVSFGETTMSSSGLTCFLCSR